MSDASHHDGHLALKVMMMPRDTNQHGTIFGGILLSHIDQAGAVGAYLHIRHPDGEKQPLVTVGMNSVEFHEPVFVGDVLIFRTSLVRIGRTSITMHVTVEAERNGIPTQVTEADVTYVAIEVDGSHRRPVPIVHA